MMQPLSSLLVLLLTLAAPTLIANDRSIWPQFLGPEGQAVQENANPPSELDLEQSVRWKIDLPVGNSSPCVWDDSIFLTSYQTQGNLLETICVNADSGEVRWRQLCPTVDEIEKCHRVNNPAAPTPATNGEIVVVYFGSFGLLAYDFAGNELWRHPLPMARVFMDYGSGSSPIIRDNKVLLFLSLGNESHLSAFSIADGSQLWKASLSNNGRTWATPVAWSEDGNMRVGQLNSNQFSAFDITDGQQLWWVDNLATNAGSSPMVAGDRLLLTSAGIQGDGDNIVLPPDFDTMISKYDENGDGKLAFKEIPNDVLFTDRHTSDGSGNLSLKAAMQFTGTDPNTIFDRDGWEQVHARVKGIKEGPMSRASATMVKTGGENAVADSHRLWEEPRGVGEVASPLIYRDLVYLIKNGGVLTVRSAESGEQIYVKRLRRANGGYYATPVAAAGRIYFASDAGVITVIEAGTEFNIVSQCDIGEPILTTPAIAGDTLYIRSKNQLIAFASH